MAGKNNIGVDTLTRYNQTVENQVQIHQQIFINQLLIDQYSQEFVPKLQQLPKLQETDKKIQKIITRLQKEPQLPYIMHQKLLFYIDKKRKTYIDDTRSVSSRHGERST